VLRARQTHILSVPAHDDQRHVRGGIRRADAGRRWLPHYLPAWARARDARRGSGFVPGAESRRTGSFGWR
jgi:hypothetical protein